ncbi:MAG TPA: hypothetical protein VHL98_10080 [Microvirga sp.]|jgi:hypothetical protein|nr:hypothetical protein [Microvirga sp.]
MITALVRAAHGTDALAATLSALVSAVAEGLVGDAVVLAAPDDADAMRIADAVGAQFVALESGQDPWRRGAGYARREWVLCLDAGDVPSEGWIRAVERFIAASPPERRLGRFPRRGHTLAEALRLRWRAAAAGGRVQAGDVVRRAVLLDGGRVTRPARIAASIERDPVFG